MVPMKVRVKTQDDRTFTVEVPSSSTVQHIKDEVEQQDHGVEANRLRVLFQGRFLEDDVSASSCGISDGHTVLLVPKPAADARRGHRRSGSTGSSHASHIGRFTPDMVRFLQAQQRFMAALQSGQAGQRSGDARPLISDEETGDLAAFEAVDWDSLVEVREGDNSDLVLGFAFGFLLGPVAGLCLIESALSRKLRAGMLVGIICEVMVAVVKMLTHIPTGV